MKMAEIQAGLGFGVKKFKLVWLFETDMALDDCIDSGWELGARATAGAKTGDKGARTRERWRWHRESASASSLEMAWRSSSPPRGPSTTRTLI